MTTGDSGSWKDVRRRLFEVLDATPSETASVVKAVPLGFPIVEATYALRERVPEKIGLIRRYLLEALWRFGPCSPAELDAMLGLGEDVIVRTLQEMEHVIPGLVCHGGAFSADDEVRQLLDSGQFTRVVTHRRRFLINGLTGKLLPINFWKFHADWRLYPDAGNPDGKFRKASGEPTEISAKIVDRGVTGRDELSRLIRSGDARRRQEYGVPAGSCELPSEPEEIQVSWVLSFLLLRADGSCKLYSAHRSPISLLDDATTSRDYLQTVCQRLKPWILNTESQPSHSDKWSEDVPEGAEAFTGRFPGEIFVRLLDPQRMLPLNDSEVPEGESGKRWLRHGLLRGRMWNPYTYKLLRIVPGDVATATRTALVRGVYALRAAVRPLSFRPGASPPLDLVRWWDKWQDQYAQELPHHCVPPRLPVATLLECADSLNDTEFLEKLERLSAKQLPGGADG